MSSIVNPLYGTPTAITITMVGLTNSSARESAAIDNTVNKFADALVVVTAKLAAGTPANLLVINVYAAASMDNTNWGDNATGANAALTVRNNTNLVLIGQITTPDSGALTYRSQPLSVAAAFGGVLPPYWSIVVENQTNLTFDATTASANYTGVNLQVV